MNKVVKHEDMTAEQLQKKADAVLARDPDIWKTISAEVIVETLGQEVGTL